MVGELWPGGTSIHEGALVGSFNQSEWIHVWISQPLSRRSSKVRSFQLG